MVVAFQQATTSGGAGGATTTTTGSHQSVSAGTGLALIFGITWNGDPGPIIACNWDNAGTPQAMTLIGSVTPIYGSSVYLGLFGLLNPNPGINLDLLCSWTNSRAYNSFSACFSGADQGSFATTFINFNSNTGHTGTTSSLSITNPSGNLAVDLFGTSSTPSAPTQTSLIASGSNVGIGMSYGSASPVPFAWTIGNNASWGDIGCSISAVSAPVTGRAIHLKDSWS